jgi:hypothetical protein
MKPLAPFRQHILYLVVIVTFAAVLVPGLYRYARQAIVGQSSDTTPADQQPVEDPVVVAQEPTIDTRSAVGTPYLPAGITLLAGKGLYGGGAVAPGQTVTLGVDLSAFTTDDLAQGQTNRYESTPSVYESMKSILKAGSNVSMNAKDDGTIHIAATSVTSSGTPGSYTAGDGLELVGSAFAAKIDGSSLARSASGLKIADGWFGSTSITTLGTISTGIWNGTAIGLAYGGTGATTQAGARANLGLGTLALQDASGVSITGGSLSGLSSLGATALTLTGKGTLSGANSLANALEVGDGTRGWQFYTEAGGPRLASKNGSRFLIDDQFRWDGGDINNPPLVLRATTDTEKPILEWQWYHDGQPFEQWDGSMHPGSTPGFKRIAWAVAHYDSPNPVDGIHQHWEIETPMADLSTLIGRFTITWGEDVATVGFPNSETVVYDDKYAYYGSDKDAGIVYDSANTQLEISGEKGASGKLYLTSTRHATKGKIFLGDVTVYEENTVRLGIGTSAPGSKLDVLTANDEIALRLRNTHTNTSNSAAILVENDISGDRAFQTGTASDTIKRFSLTSAGLMEWGAGGGSTRDTNLFRNGANELRTNDSFVVDGNFTVTGSCTGCSSDARLKVNLADMGDPLTLLKAVRAVRFEYASGTTQAAYFGGRQIGVIAQEVETVLPELVGTDADGYKFVRYDKLVVPAIAAINQLDLKLDDQGTRLSTLEAALASENGDSTGDSGSGYTTPTGISPEEIRSLTLTEGLRAGGPSTFDGTVEFKANTSFSGPAGFAEATFGRLVTFLGDVVFRGRVSFDRDTAGIAIMKAGTREVRVTFARPFARTPVVTVTGERENGGYYLQDKSTAGFTIVTKDPVSADTTFNWIAILTVDPNITESAPALAPTGSVESTPVPTRSATPPPATEKNTGNQQWVELPSPTEIASPNASPTPASASVTGIPVSVPSQPLEPTDSATEDPSPTP